MDLIPTLSWMNAYILPHSPSTNLEPTTSDPSQAGPGLRLLDAIPEKHSFPFTSHLSRQYTVNTA